MPTATTSPKYARRGALKMFQGGNNPQTHYNCSVIERARRLKVMVERLPGEFGNPRMLHRPDLFSVFSDHHPNRGKGKYIDDQAVMVRDGHRWVMGAHNVIPFVPGDGSYRIIMSAFHQESEQSIRDLEAKEQFNRIDGMHLHWQGRRSQDEAIYVTPWYQARALYDICESLSARWLQRLRHSQSPRPGVEERLGTFEKFEHALLVMHRARHVKSMATGITEEKGGATPYGMPLDQCNMALDMAYLTHDFTRGEEVAAYHYRLAYGRSHAWNLSYEDWAAAGHARYAYVSDDVRSRVLGE